MSELIEFLNARYDEEETEANKQPHSYEYMAGYEIEATSESNYPCEPYLRIAKARVLREVEAKRRILEIHGTRPDPCDAHGPDLASIPCETLALLALPYADHAEYREEWKP